MSAFLVRHMTIYTIAGYILSKPAAEFANQFVRCGAFTKETLVRRLGDMNARAIQSRYGAGRTADEVEAWEKELDPIACSPGQDFKARVQAYKSFRCFLYQCSEGDVPLSPLYKAVEAAADYLAAEIVPEIPEYEEAKWD